MKKIMAIDASTTSTGIAIFEEKQLAYPPFQVDKLIKYYCISKDSSFNVHKRILFMTQQIKKIYLQYKPNYIIMEEVLPEDVKHNQNVFKALIYLQASVVLMLSTLGQQVEFFTASHWRKVCGIKTGQNIKRNELKQASQNLVKSIYKIDVNDDVSDAICLGIAYIIQNKQKSAF